MNYKISAADGYSLSFKENAYAASVLQNISLLLNTKRGTVPMYRDFGLPMEFIDKPIDVAETIAYAEISEALEEFEPRAELLDVAFEKTSDGRMSVVAEVSISDEQSG